MAYFIFTKNCEDIKNTLCRMAENELDFNSLNASSDVYKIIEVSQNDFNDVKYGRKLVDSYNLENVINYVNLIYGENDIQYNKKQLQDYVTKVKSALQQFIDSNPNHGLFARCNSYLNQLTALNLDNINYPLEKSLEQHLYDIGQTSFHPLQIP